MPRAATKTHQKADAPAANARATRSGGQAKANAKGDTSANRPQRGQARVPAATKTAAAHKNKINANSHVSAAEPAANNGPAIVADATGSPTVEDDAEVAETVAPASAPKKVSGLTSAAVPKPTPIARSAARPVVPTANVLASRNSDLEAKNKRLEEALAKATAENIKLSKYKSQGPRVALQVTQPTIPRPSGEFGKAGLSLHHELGMEGKENDARWNNFLAGMRKCVIEAQLDFKQPIIGQSTVRLAQLFTAAKLRYPFLNRYQNDWPAREVVKNVLVNRRRYLKHIGQLEGDAATENTEHIDAESTGTERADEPGTAMEEDEDEVMAL